jgi:hypothetical protein
MSRPSSPSSGPSVAPSLPERAAGFPARPAGSLDRIEVPVHYTAWDVYRMEVRERWQRSYSADSSVVASTFFLLAAGLYLLVDVLYFALAPTPWMDAVLIGAFWLLVLWGAWWAVAPILKARRHAEAALSEPLVRFVFSPEGVEIVRQDVSMRIAWPGIRRVRETWFSFLIYPRLSSPYVTSPDGRLIQVLPWMKLYFTLPRHCFVDAADLRLFRTLVRKHVTVK